VVDGGDSETDLGEVHHCELHHPNGLPRKAVYHSLGLHRSLLAPSLERDREERLGGERERRKMDITIFNRTLIDTWGLWYFLTKYHINAMLAETAAQTVLGLYLHWFWELRDTSYLVLRFRDE
jgi:hypothetical protein